jgi:putative Holliday junction resolvase
MITKDIADLQQKGALKKAMGIDYGLKKTGIAITDKDLIMTFPLCTLNIKNPDLLLDNIKTLAHQYEIALLVLGIPDQAYYDASLYLNFASLLNSKLLLPVYLQDESYTSKMANIMLLDSGLNKRKRAKVDDQVAAKLILDAFLERLQNFKKRFLRSTN